MSDCKHVGVRWARLARHPTASALSRKRKCGWRIGEWQRWLTTDESVAMRLHPLDIRKLPLAARMGNADAIDPRPTIMARYRERRRGPRGGLRSWTCYRWRGGARAGSQSCFEDASSRLPARASPSIERRPARGDWITARQTCHQCEYARDVRATLLPRHGSPSGPRASGANHRRRSPP